MPTSVKLSKEFLIVYGGQVIARATDFDFEVNKATIDITTLDSAGWRELLVDAKEWKVGFSALVTRHTPAATLWSSATSYPKDALVRITQDSYIYISLQASNTNHSPYTDNGTWWKKVRYDYDGLIQEIKENNSPVEVILKSGTIGDKFEAGDGFLTSLKASGSVGDKVVYSGTVEGTADLETFTIQ